MREGYDVTLSATKGLQVFGVRLNCRFFATLRMTEGAGAMFERSATLCIQFTSKV
jgi:hypothetical protein